MEINPDITSNSIITLDSTNRRLLSFRNPQGETIELTDISKREISLFEAENNTSTDKNKEEINLNLGVEVYASKNDVDSLKQIYNDGRLNQYQNVDFNNENYIREQREKLGESEESKYSNQSLNLQNNILIENENENEDENEDSIDLTNLLVSLTKDRNSLNSYDLEKIILQEYKKIELNVKLTYNINSSTLKVEDNDAILKMNQKNEFLESSYINKSDANNVAYSLNSDSDNNSSEESIIEDQLIKDYFGSRIEYNSVLIERIMKKYMQKPLNPNEKLKRSSTIQFLGVKNKNLLSLKEDYNYKKFSAHMREMDKKLNDAVAELSYGESNIDRQTEIKAFIRGESRKTYIQKQITKLNSDNSFLKILLLTIYDYPINVILYKKWKTQLLKLLSSFRQNKEDMATKLPKINIKNLKTIFLLEKLIKNKQNKTVGKRFSIDTYFKNTKNIDWIHFYNHEKDNRISTLSFLYFSNLMILYDFLIDFQIIYFLIICPLVMIISSQTITILSPLTCIFNFLYFFEILREFRRLKYTETNFLETNLNKLFYMCISSRNFYLGIASLIPYVSLYPNVTQFGHTTFYGIFFLFPVFRVFGSGKSMKTLEKTKYAMVFRLMLLIMKFVILAHWTGLLFVNYVTFDYFSETYFLENDCISIVSGEKQIKTDCKYIIALMDGTYLIPGAFISNLNVTKTFDFIFLFLTYYIGQIVVAYVFGGVSNLIENLNQAANIFRAKLDALKSFMFFYKFDDIVRSDIEEYYEYMWMKKRNLIYDEELLSKLSISLRAEISSQVYPHNKLFLNDLYAICKNGNKKIISTLITSMKEIIVFPFERVYTQGEVIKGLFILTDGTLIFTDGKNETCNDKMENEESKQEKRHDLNHRITVDRKTYLQKLHFNKKNNIKEEIVFDKDKNMRNTNQTFHPLDSIFLKTGRAIETCYVDDFADLFLIDLNFFDTKLMVNYPSEMLQLKEVGMKQGLSKIGENSRIQKMIYRHSARSIGDYYEDKFNLVNIWIDIKLKFPTFQKENSNVGNSAGNSNESCSKGLFEFKI